MILLSKGKTLSRRDMTDADADAFDRTYGIGGDGWDLIPE